MGILSDLGIGAVTSGGKTILQYSGSKKAQREMEHGITGAEDLTRSYGQKAEGYQTPYYQAGTNAFGTLAGNVQSGAYDVAPFEYQTPEFNFQADPGYQFRLQQGMQGVQNSAAAQGKGLSGATLRALAKYGSGLASQEYGNAYNRYAQDRGFGYGVARDMYGSKVDEMGRRYGRLGDIAGYGERAGTRLSSMATDQGNTLAGLSLGRGNVRAGGVKERTNILSRGIDDMSQLVRYGMANAPTPGQQNYGYYPPESTSWFGRG
jgi:hypothetical protein